MRKRGTLFLLLLSTLLAFQCRTSPDISVTAETFYDTELFRDVQLARMFEDSKTFVDLTRDRSFRDLERLYLQERDRIGFDLQDFVHEHFTDPGSTASSFETDMSRDMYSHISAMWNVLSRGPDTLNQNTSRIPLPNPYIVPGGRFKEIYYWDSYFTMIGLVSDNRMEIARDMLGNFAHMIDSLGFIPNGTRDYYLTRSQPPFFALMVDMLEAKDSSLQGYYFPHVAREYEYWMEGAETLAEGQAENRVFRAGESIFMNRFWDSARTPRPESYGEDVQLAEDFPEDQKGNLYGHLRAAASSGWDFSSRWYAREGEFASTETANILPVDLNCLLYFMETELAKGFKERGDAESAEKLEKRAKSRKKLINTMMWDPQAGFYKDFNFKSNSRCGEITLAGVYPLYFGIASRRQAEKVKDHLMEDFLKPGGLVTTLRITGQQWDAPNGWAPLQWMSVQGLIKYGYTNEARDIIERWLSLNQRVYRQEGKMMEKYNVVDTTLLSGGGEYPTQDGFGWTNGVALGFRDLLLEMED
jgi:alpha,alpha-trehalase